MSMLNCTPLCVLTLLLVPSCTVAVAQDDPGTDILSVTGDVTVENDFYKISVKGPSKQFTVRTGRKHSAGENLNVIYHHTTSFFSVRAYSADGKFDTYRQDKPDQLQLTAARKYKDGFQLIYKTKDGASRTIQVIQDVRLEGYAERTATVRVTARVSAPDKVTTRVAMRYLWDFEIGSDDGPSLNFGDEQDIKVERTFDNPTVDRFTVQNNQPIAGGKTLAVVGTVKLDSIGPFSANPSRITHACWETARHSAFDYALKNIAGAPRIVSDNSRQCDNSGTGGDNAILYYFGHDFKSAKPIANNTVIVPSGEEGNTVAFTAFLAKEIRVAKTFVKTDTDGDGLYDSWETSGVDLNGDGVPEVSLKELPGHDKNKKNVYVYYDWVGAKNKPNPKSLAMVRKSFADQDIDLHFIEGSAVTELGGKPIDDDIGKMQGYFYNWGEFSRIKAENFPTRFWPVYRYALFAGNYAGSGSSGIARGLPSSDFMVTLGSFTLTGEARITAEAGTIQHELGHTLALHHGGRDDHNYKPNYHSVMNYKFQFEGVPYDDDGEAKHRVDYSIEDPEQDWKNLVLNGGAIGDLGAMLKLDATTDLRKRVEPTDEDVKALKRGEIVDFSERYHLLKNGNFERLKPNIRPAGFTSYPIRQGDANPLVSWEVGGAGDYSLFVSRQAGDAAKGREHLKFLGRASVSQTVQTEAGGKYLLSFDLAAPGGRDAGRLEVLLNNQKIGEAVPSSTTQGKYESRSFEFIADSAKSKIEFRNPKQGYGPWLDNIRLDYELGGERSAAGPDIWAVLDAGVQKGEFGKLSEAIEAAVAAKKLTDAQADAVQKKLHQLEELRAESPEEALKEWNRFRQQRRNGK